MSVKLPTLDLPVLAELPTPDAPASNIVIPPRAVEPLPDPVAFAADAGLALAQAETVVLRVRVGGDGRVVDVVVDVPSRDARADDVALAYVRALHWIGGKLNGAPAPIWVRIGVRFDIHDIQRTSS
ncbi:MAG: TonB family protein [Cyanobacteria bacterium SZAS LIN-2]|nr:TonB family protein [Cyanobacteria bacterium SZAS LIN-2]